MVLGVIIGVILLLLLIGLVVLQGMIEWGGFDTDKLFGGKKSKDEAPGKEDKRVFSKPLVKGLKKKTVKPTKKKGARK
ncbi:MAG: hypothetical protein WCJ94_01500 [bacterium]